MKYVKVIVDNNTNATDQLFTYSAPDETCVGQKVSVPFSIHNRTADAYVAEDNCERPEGVKQIKSVKEIFPDVCLSKEAVSTALWMRSRYLCRYIEAVKCFLPVSEVKRKTKDPFENIDLEPDSPKALTLQQRLALDPVKQAVTGRTNKVFLLHGVTGSGKTEVYLQAMGAVIESGRAGIVLVPEISLTPQTVSRFMNRFGRESVAVLHSRLTPQQRAAQYKLIESGSIKLVIGARSAIFAPLKDIGLIIMDEEHETSYKSDKSPKYDTLEVAEKRAMTHGCPILLGSATPSVTDYYRSETGLFERLEISERYNSVPLPRVTIVDMTAEVRAGNRSLFSKELAEAILKCLENRQQVILFLNRRGYFGSVSCRECGYTVKCPECAVSMPYHKDENACICHYCGRRVPMPRVCPECGSKIIGRYGAGTEQVEEKIKELFPEASTVRLDLDTVKKKGELEKILRDFGRGKTDILVGTQIVAKGLDFANVGLVGIISADVTLNIPDFRSAERSFQLITQAAGRSGRGGEQGRVIVQTYSPDNSALLAACDHDYRGFYEREIMIRKAALYPPFADIFQLVIQDENPALAESTARKCAQWLRSRIPEDVCVLGPAPPLLARIGGLTRFQLLIKSPAGKRRETSLLVWQLRKEFEGSKGEASLMTVDINPFSFV